MSTGKIRSDDFKKTELDSFLSDADDGKQVNHGVSPPINSTQIRRLSAENSSTVLKKEPENVSTLQTVLSDKHIPSESEDEQQNNGRKKAEEEASIDYDTTCGIGSFRPKWLQKFAKIEIYVALYCIMGIFHGSIYTYLIGVTSTLEKRFAFRSKTSGSLLMIDEITPSLMGVVVGYIGGKTHRPRLLALGMILSSACCFISSIPYFVYGSAKHLSVQTTENKTGIQYCSADILKKDFCADDNSDAPPTLPAVVLLLFALFIKGFANISMVIGIVYMDDNSKKRNVPLYFALSISLRILGPVCGYLTSSFTLKFYENPFEDPGFSPEDPRWIGAWWMGFVLNGSLILLFAIPLILFPKRLPIFKRKAKSEQDKNIKEFFKGMIQALKRLVRNPLYVTQVLITIFATYGNLDFYMMIPKYMENQFRLSASDANLYSGPPPLAAYLLTTVIGGFLIWKYKPGIKFLLGGSIVAEFVFVLGFISLLFPQCEHVDMKNYGYNDNGLILTDDCNANCDCTQTAYTPFCGPDGQTTYFSPCFAGCATEVISSNSSEKQKVFNNCSCVPSTGTDLGGPITEGYCPDENCWSQALIFIMILPLPPLISSFFTVSKSMIMLRSIHPDDKSVALGTFESLLCITSFLPLPVIVGAIVDSTCLVWEETCGEIGNCWFYDIDKFKYLLFGFSAFFSMLSSIGFAVLYTMHHRVRDLYAEEDDDDDIELDEKRMEAVTEF